MLAKPSLPISLQLEAAEKALTNALANVDILKRLTENGYNAARIAEGQKLYQDALLAVRRHTALVQDNGDREASSAKVTRNAQEAYQSLAQIFRKIWPEDKEQLQILGIPAQPPRSTAGFLSAASVLFDAPLKDPELMALLADLGYPRLLLASERAKVAELEKLVRKQENSEKEIRAADQEQQLALKVLNEWMGRFVKKARVVLQNKKDFLDKMGLLDRSPRAEAPKNAQEPRQAKRG
ncbi:hypothetical protein HY768_09640 [candidate division TA06 bacterium]|uniref:Uncharacterized protein n=1 Tax=candidate division TA06 bacterium TaxID=2250710 RepID=A0A933MK90_UNCT6|nr:hypothetical protein [candidate division TA06 bacterium]